MEKFSLSIYLYLDFMKTQLWSETFLVFLNCIHSDKRSFDDKDIRFTVDR